MVDEKCYALRGATTIDEDNPQSVDERVGEMISFLYRENNITDDDIAFVIFSMTKDITSKNAASAARSMGYCRDTPLFCVQEAYIDGGLPKCIRVLVLVNHERKSEKKNIYLRGAKNLRKEKDDKNEK